MTTATMPGAEGGFLAHISDTVTATDEKVDQLLERQDTVIAILTRMSEDLRAQSEMLAEILGAALTDPEPSPVALQLMALTAAVNENTTAVVEMAEDLASIPSEIGDAVAEAIGADRSPPT
jgi:hypothetical protein